MNLPDATMQRGLPITRASTLTNQDQESYALPRGHEWPRFAGQAQQR